MIGIRNTAQRIQLIMLAPEKFWAQAKSESRSIVQLYLEWVLILFAAGAVATFIGAVLSADSSAARSFGYVFTSFVIVLAGLYLGAQVLNQLLPKFGAKSDPVRCFTLTAYSATPFALGALLQIIPSTVTTALSSVLGLYSLVIFAAGLRPILGIPEERKLGFFVVSIFALSAMFFLLVLLTLPLANLIKV